MLAHYARIKDRVKAWGIAAVLTGTMLAAPIAGIMQPAQADPPRHAPAWGYRAKHKSDYDRRDRDDYRRDWKRSSTRRSRSKRYTKQRRHHKRYHKRRYRLRYRTRYDRHGKPYRQYHRVYY